MDNLLGLPILASEHGAVIDRVINLVHVMMLVAFVLWTILFIVPLIRFRKSRHPNAKYRGLQSRFPLPFILVAAMVVGEAYLLLAISKPFWDDHIAAAPMTDADVFQVRIIAQQYQWNIQYSGPDGVFGATDPELVDDMMNPLGLDSDDPNGKDDIYSLAVLNLPVDKTIQVHLSSKDVIHSFFLPEFRVKQDAIPGMTFQTRFVPTMTTAELRETTGDETRQFEIACAQLCGLGHYRMRGFVTVQTEEEFDAWYDEQLELKAFYADDE